MSETNQTGQTVNNDENLNPNVPANTANVAPQPDPQPSNSDAQPSTRANRNDGPTPTQLAPEPFLECRSRRDASEIQTSAFNRIKNAHARAMRPEWVESLTKYTVRESIRSWYASTTMLSWHIPNCIL